MQQEPEQELEANDPGVEKNFCMYSASMLMGQHEYKTHQCSGMLETPLNRQILAVGSEENITGIVTDVVTSTRKRALYPALFLLLHSFLSPVPFTLCYHNINI
ncbi:hypothetical protein STEG23_024498 [Scotinomys teguina]